MPFTPPPDNTRSACLGVGVFGLVNALSPLHQPVHHHIYPERRRDWRTSWRRSRSSSPERQAASVAKLPCSFTATAGVSPACCPHRIAEPTGIRCDHGQGETAVAAEFMAVRAEH